jgi:hypothetical protein
MSAMVRCCLARCFAVMKLGMAMAAAMPRKATRASPPTATPMTMAKVFAPLPVPGGRGAPLVGLPHVAHGKYETASTGLPQ